MYIAFIKWVVQIVVNKIKFIKKNSVIERRIQFWLLQKNTERIKEYFSILVMLLWLQNEVNWILVFDSQEFLSWKNL